MERRCRTSSKYVYYALQHCHLGKRQKDYLIYSSEEIMSQSGIGLNDTNQRKRIFQSRRMMSRVHNWWDIDQSKQVVTMCGYGLLSIEPRDKMILDIRISIERSILVAEQFIQSLIRKYGKHNILTDWWWDVVSTSI